MFPNFLVITSELMRASTDDEQAMQSSPGAAFLQSTFSVPGSSGPATLFCLAGFCPENRTQAHCFFNCSKVKTGRTKGKNGVKHPFMYRNVPANETTITLVDIVTRITGDWKIIVQNNGTTHSES
jgi:hypothetical protein